MTTKPGFRPDINALRALAVGVVVLFHFRLPGFGGGFTGVDIFFVISGYLMTKIVFEDLQKGQFNYLSFIGMRIVRIWPALIALLLILLILGAIALPPTDYKELANQLRAAAIFNSNNYYSRGIGYFTSEVDERWLLHTWSLSVEWQFYMLYPAILLIANYFAKKTDEESLRSIFLIWLVGIFAISFSWSLWLTKHSQSSAFFSLSTRIWEMLGGGIVYLVDARFRHISGVVRSRIQAISFGALLLTVLAASIGDWEKMWPGGWASIPVLLTMLALVCGAPTQGPWRRVIENRAIQYLGLRSFSIYLWHWPIVIALNYVTFNQSVMPYMPALKAAGLVGSILLGHLSFRLVEQKFKYQRKGSWLQANTVKALTGMAASIAFAFFVVQTSGWIERTGADQIWYQSFSELKNTPLSPKECENFGLQKEQLVVCSINSEKSGPRVLVYGDSHAQHLYPWFAKNSNSRVDFFISNGCPPVPNFNRKEPGFFCDEYVNEALRRAMSADYRTIFVAGNWSGVMALCHAKEGLCLKHENQHVTDKAEFLARANADAWRSLARSGKEVVVVDQSPISNFNVMTTTLRRRFFNLPEITSFEDTQSGDSAGKKYLDSIFKIASDTTGIHRISLKQEICPHGVCKAFDETSKLPILIDRSHLAPWWIEKHGNPIQKYFSHFSN